jgi:hypothetical protein
MKKKPIVHTSSVPDVDSATKVFGVSQRTRAQRIENSAASACTSLTINVNKGTVTPGVPVQNSIILS